MADAEDSRNKSWWVRCESAADAGGFESAVDPFRRERIKFSFDHFREEVIKQPEAKFPVTDFRREICYRGGARFPFDHFRMEVIKQPEAKISRSRFP